MWEGCRQQQQSNCTRIDKSKEQKEEEEKKIKNDAPRCVSIMAALKKKVVAGHDFGFFLTQVVVFLTSCAPCSEIWCVTNRQKGKKNNQPSN